MNMICPEELCSGCSACFNICPSNAIRMFPNKQGFLYPEIIRNVCINCQLCKRVCPIINDTKAENSIDVAYACYTKNEYIRLKSSSGGIFTELSQIILEKGGVVFGVAFSDDFKSVKHIGVDNIDDLEKLRGSKYVQSDIGDTYKQAEEFLKCGRFVLFTGTPCQIAGLKKYLGRDYDNLLTQDIICHGVPSPLVWNRYLDYQCDRHGTELDTTKKPDFRCKDKGWTDYSLKLHFKDGSIYNKLFSQDLYMRAFLENICLRPSCYACKSKSYNRNSDITIADFWGIKEIDDSMYDNKGTSLVFVNTKKGENIISSLKDKITIAEENIEEALRYNWVAYKSVELNKHRKIFMKLIRKRSFDKAYDIALKKNKCEEINNLVRYYANRIVHKFLLL